MSAEEAKKEEGAAVEKKKSNVLLIVIIVVLILIIIGGAVVAMMLMNSEGDGHGDPKHPEATKEAAAHKDPHAKEAAAPKAKSADGEDSRKLSDIGILYPLDTFTVNLKSESGRSYLKATISLELNAEQKELSIELDKKIPVIRDRIIRILSAKSLEEISSKKGKEKVGEQIMETLNAMMVDGSIKGIYFTEFVIQ